MSCAEKAHWTANTSPEYKGALFGKDQRASAAGIGGEMESLERWAPQVRSVVRIMAGLLFLEHGLQKLFGFPAAGPQMTPLLWAQALIEVVGGVLLTIGAFTRPVAFVLSGDMAAAFFIAHFPRSFYPAVNGGDAAVLYCFVFFYIFCAGGGPWSVDRSWLNRR
jgi:putative oxidoreductase